MRKQCQFFVQLREVFHVEHISDGGWREGWTGVQNGEVFHVEHFFWRYLIMRICHKSTTFAEIIRQLVAL
jgi:hypothetical protein